MNLSNAPAQVQAKRPKRVSPAKLTPVERVASNTKITIDVAACIRNTLYGLAALLIAYATYLTASAAPGPTQHQEAPAPIIERAKIAKQVLVTGKVPRR